MGLLSKKEYRQLSADEREEWDQIDAVFKEIQETYTVQSTIKPNIKKFDLINSKMSARFFRAWKVSDGTTHFTLCLIEYGFEYTSVHNHGSSIKSQTDKYFFGLVDSPKDFGRTLFRPETIADKISEFFQSVEIDIEGEPEFSHKYYVLSNDEPKFFKAFDTPLLSYLRDEQPFTLEFYNQKALFRLNKSIDLKETLKLCEIGLGLTEALNS